MMHGPKYIRFLFDVLSHKGSPSNGLRNVVCVCVCVVCVCMCVCVCGVCVCGCVVCVCVCGVCVCVWCVCVFLSVCMSSYSLSCSATKKINSCCINLDVVTSVLIVRLSQISSPGCRRTLQPMTAQYSFRQQNSLALPLLSPIYKLSPGLSPC